MFRSEARICHVRAAPGQLLIRTLAGTATIAVFAACTQVQPREAQSKVASADSAAVIAASQAIVAAFGHNDRNSYFALFDPNATFIFHTTPQRLESRAAYQREWETWHRDLGFRVRSCTSSEARVQLFGDVAILTHLVRTEITTVQGDATLDERETIVFRRRGGNWIAVHEHLSPQPAPGA